MNEFRISIVGRARVGKSILLTRFVKNPNEIIGLSNSGSDSTKVPTELILNEDIIDTVVECHEKDGKASSIAIDNLAQLHKDIQMDERLQEKISHIVIKSHPSEWVKKVLKETNTNQLVLVDTEGVSGDVKNLNLRNWKANLFILLFKSDNKSEFAKSISKMKSALLGNSIWYAVSLLDVTLTNSCDELDLEIEDLEKEARSIKEAFSDELNKLEDEKSLLSMKLLEFKRKDTVLAIPNIKLKSQYKSGREYTDKKLEEFLLQAIKDNGEDINIQIDTNDLKKRAGAANLLKYLSDTAMYALNDEEINGIKPSCKKYSFEDHLNKECRLKSYDRGYLVEKQWEVTSYLRAIIYDKLNEVKYDAKLPLSIMEQAALVQKFYNDFSNKIIWTNYFISSHDGREGTEQASIITMLHSVNIVKALQNTVIPVRELLGKVILTDSGWSNNYLIDENRKSNSYTPIFCASKVCNTIDVFDKFYKFVIKPYTVYAINYTAIRLGYKSAQEIIKEYKC